MYLFTNKYCIFLVDRAIEMICRDANANDEVLKVVMQYLRRRYPLSPEWICRKLFENCTHKDRVNIVEIFFPKNDSPNGKVPTFSKVSFYTYMYM